MIVWVYINTRKQVGDKDHLKVLASEDAAETWIQENDRLPVAETYTVHLSPPQPVGFLLLTA